MKQTRTNCEDCDDVEEGVLDREDDLDFSVFATEVVDPTEVPVGVEAEPVKFLKNPKKINEILNATVC